MWRYEFFLREDTGLELSEYAIGAALIILAIIASLTTLEGKINLVMSELSNRVQS